MAHYNYYPGKHGEPSLGRRDPVRKVAQQRRRLRNRLRDNAYLALKAAGFSEGDAWTIGAIILNQGPASHDLLRRPDLALFAQTCLAGGDR